MLRYIALPTFNIPYAIFSEGLKLTCCGLSVSFVNIALSCLGSTFKKCNRI